jgi:hypothetical protein
LAAASGALRFALEPRAAIMLKVSGTPVDADGQLLSGMTGRIHVAADGLQGQGPRADAGQVPRADFAPGGGQLRIANTTYDYGIGIHADSRLEVRTAGEFTRFSARAGLQQGHPAGGGKVVFRVYGDATLLYQSGPADGGDAAVAIDIPVAGVDVLELVVATVDPPRSGQPTPVAAWADARLH